MAISGGMIDGIPVIELKHTGRSHTPTLLVIHYSVTDTVDEAVAALNAAGLSYDILIEKNGDAFQTRPFTKTAAHPGLSNWKPTAGVKLGSSVQIGSIGICLMNKGYAFGSSPSAPGKLIYNPNDPSMARWEKYPAKQIASCRKIAADVIATYAMSEVVGHHDVAIMGKFDPGPLFDLKQLNELVANPLPAGFRTRVKAGAGVVKVHVETKSGSASVGTLKPGDIVHIRAIAYSGKKANCIDPKASKRKRYLTRWASIDVDGSNTHTGFVDMKALSSTPLDPALAALL